MIAHHDCYRNYLETLTPSALARLADYVADDVRFRDPFNDVVGRVAMERVLRDMFNRIDDIRFVVRHCLNDSDVCLMAWRFEGRTPSIALDFDGTSVVRFAQDGRVIEHVDHWDAAGAVYAHVPLVGTVLRGLRRRLSTR